MKRLGVALLLVAAVALVTRHHEHPAPAPTAPVVSVEQRDPNLGPVGSLG